MWLDNSSVRTLHLLAEQQILLLVVFVALLHQCSCLNNRLLGNFQRVESEGLVLPGPHFKPFSQDFEHVGERQSGSSREMLLETLVGSFDSIIGSDVLWIGSLVPKSLLTVNPNLNSLG